MSYQAYLKNEVIMLNYIRNIKVQKPVSEQKLMDDIYRISQTLNRRGICVEQRLSANPFVRHWSEEISDALDYYSKANVVTINSENKGERSRYFFAKGKCIDAVIKVVNDGYEVSTLQQMKQEIKHTLQK